MPIRAEVVGRLTDRIGLGVLPRVVGPDLVDEVLAQTGRVEKRRRLLPARVVVYFVLALTLFFDDPYEEVMRKLVEGLRFLRAGDTDWQVPTSPALCKARARLGEEPVRELFGWVAVPLAGAGTPDAWLAGRRVMAIDGVQMTLPTTRRRSGAATVTRRWRIRFRRWSSWVWASAAPTRSSTPRSVRSPPVNATSPALCWLASRRECW
ncbi:transposase domain-containing protein [Nocardia sp. NPDC058497]|uniref:transposase domain-containing protein n=1 Tax=Nocardia sp. NPDC058497 TaxID=3346529 RepID=UPI00365CAFCC